jgi:nucleotide-binding universal stress UspA family protein
MATRPYILCPTDFSDASRGALRYAGALAEHFYAGLTVLAVDDPFLSDAAAAAIDEHWLDEQTRAGLATFVRDSFGTTPPTVAELKTEVAIGRPAAEILRVAAETHADAIVMSTHGVTGVRKMMFGSVTERVLRDTPIPVVVTPAGDPGPSSLEEWKRNLKTVLVPIDLSPWSPQQVAVARGLAEALGTEIVFAHILPDDDRERRLAAHHQLDEIIHGIPPALRPSMTMGVGNTAEEIARIAKQRQADVIVMGLHTQPGIRHHMGRVTYALLCQTPTLVLAWPPARTHTALAATPPKASYVF